MRFDIEITATGSVEVSAYIHGVSWGPDSKDFIREAQLAYHDGATVTLDTGEERFAGCRVTRFVIAAPFFGALSRD